MISNALLRKIIFFLFFDIVTVSAASQDIKLSMEFDREFPDTITIKESVYKSIAAEPELPLEVSLVNRYRLKIGIYNINNLQYSVEKREGNKYVHNEFCDVDLYLPLIPSEGIKIVKTSRRLVSERVNFPPSCTFTQGGHFRVKYFFVYYYKNEPKKVFSPWLYFYVDNSKVFP